MEFSRENFLTRLQEASVSKGPLLLIPQGGPAQTLFPPKTTDKSKMSSAFRYVNFFLQCEMKNMNTEQVCKVRTACEGLLARVSGTHTKTTFGRVRRFIWMWNPLHWCVARQFAKIQATLAERPVSCVSYNLGKDYADYELLLARDAHSSGIREYVKINFDSSIHTVPTPEGFEARFYALLGRAQNYHQNDDSFQGLVEGVSLGDLYPSFSILPSERQQKITQNLDAVKKCIYSVFSAGSTDKATLESICKKLDFLADPERPALAQNLLNRAIHEHLKARRHEAERHAARQIKSQLPDVCFLQEVGSQQRGFVKHLGAQYQRDEYVHQSIFLHKERFVDAVDVSNMAPSAETRSTMMLATDCLTGRRCLFISAHLEGFDYDAPAGEQLEARATRGDKQAQNILNVIEQLRWQFDEVIMGADVNASPEKRPQRFKILEKGQFRYTSVTEATNTHAIDQNQPDRIIDFIFARTLYRFKPSQITMSMVDKIDFNPDHNPSDHRPIRAVVKFGPKKWFWQRFTGFESR